jgi:hypothetical protein
LVSHEEVCGRLLKLPRGEVARLWGVVVRRPDPWTWEVGGTPAALLLVAIDGLMALSGHRVGSPAGHEPKRGAA